MSTLKIAVLYDRVWEDEAADAGAQDKAPVTRTLDKKEVEEEVRRGPGQAGARGHPPRDRRHAQEPAQPGQGRVRSGVQPHRVVRGRRHRRLQDCRLPGTHREALHRIGHARPAAGAGQGHRQEDLRLPWRPHAGVRQVVPRTPGLLARPAVPGHREAGARGRLDRHRVQRRGQLDPGADGTDGLAARALRLARSSSRNTSRAASSTWA